MSEAGGKEILSLSLSRHVFRQLELCAAAAQLELGSIIETALDDYLAAIEQCDPDVRALVGALVPPPVERD